MGRLLILVLVLLVWKNLLVNLVWVLILSSNFVKFIGGSRLLIILFSCFRLFGLLRLVRGEIVNWGFGLEILSLIVLFLLRCVVICL